MFEVSCCLIHYISDAQLLFLCRLPECSVSLLPCSCMDTSLSAHTLNSHLIYLLNLKWKSSWSGGLSWRKWRLYHLVLTLGVCPEEEIILYPKVCKHSLIFDKSPPAVWWCAALVMLLMHLEHITGLSVDKHISSMSVIQTKKCNYRKKTQYEKWSFNAGGRSSPTWGPLQA